MTDDQRPEEVELGEELEPVIRGRAPVVAVRMSPDLFARLSDYASARGMTMSDVVRLGVERLLVGATVGAVNVVTGAFIPSSTFVAVAPPAQSSARNVARDIAAEDVTDLSLTA